MKLKCYIVITIAPASNGVCATARSAPWLEVTILTEDVYCLVLTLYSDTVLTRTVSFLLFAFQTQGDLYSSIKVTLPRTYSPAHLTKNVSLQECSRLLVCSSVTTPPHRQ